jgi:Tol biopolymer transport system component
MHDQRGWHYADIYRVALDGSGRMERITHFADVPTYRASNPVISDDGRYMAFQMARSGQAAGTGYGIFLFDFQKAGIASR